MFLLSLAVAADRKEKATMLWLDCCTLHCTIMLWVALFTALYNMRWAALFTALSCCGWAALSCALFTPLYWTALHSCFQFSCSVLFSKMSVWSDISIHSLLWSKTRACYTTLWSSKALTFKECRADRHTAQCKVLLDVSTPVVFHQKFPIIL